MDEGITIRDVLDAEMEQLAEYGEVAVEFFHGLAGDIRQQFTESLNDLLTQELPAFQQQVSRSFSMSAATAPLADVVSGSLEQALDGLLPSGSAFGDVFGAAIGGALRAMLGDVSRGRSVEIGRVVRGATQGGNARLDRLNRAAGGLDFSHGQQSASLWENLSRGQRNL